MKYTFHTILLCFFFVTALYSQTPDNTFGTDGKMVINHWSEYLGISSVLYQPDGKIIVGGYEYDAEFYYPSMTVWRLNSDGSPDQDFGTNGTVIIPGVSQYGGYLAMQGDKIIGLGTSFDRDGEQNDSLVLFRLKPNGSLDPGFGKNGKVYTNFGGGFRQIAYALLVKPGGKILVAGELQKQGSAKDNAGLAQFLSNGKVDSSFGINGTASANKDLAVAGLAIALLPGNKFIAGFRYLDSDNKYKTCLARFNANGTLDKTFGVKGIIFNKDVTTDPYNAKMAIAIQPNGKIVEYVSTVTDNILYRYNANGSIDKAFGGNGHVVVPVTGYAGPSLSVVLDVKNRRILVNNISHDFSISAYHADGTPDLSFGVNGILTADFSNLVSGNIYDIKAEQLLLQPDQKIVCAGFINDNNGAEVGVARFTNTEALNATAVTLSHEEIKAALYPNPATSVLHIKGLNANNRYELSIADAKGNIVATKQVDYANLYHWNIQYLAGGLYYVNISSGSKKITIKFIKQ